MEKLAKILIRGIFVLMIGASVALTATACGSKTVLSIDNSQEGTYVINADGAKSDAMVMTNFNVPEGSTAITIASGLTEGKLHVKVGANLDVDEIVSVDAEEGETPEVPEDLTDVESVAEMDVEAGMSDTTIPLESGDYSITITGTDQKASGSVTITAQ